MPLHPQIAALAAQLEELSGLLRAHGDRLWADRIDLCRHLIADSNFAGVERFLRLFDGEGLGAVMLPDPRFDTLRQAARALAERLAKEEGAD